MFRFSDFMGQTDAFSHLIAKPMGPFFAAGTHLDSTLPLIIWGRFCVNSILHTLKHLLVDSVLTISRFRSNRAVRRQLDSERHVEK